MTWKPPPVANGLIEIRGCFSGRGARASRPFFIWGGIQVVVFAERTVLGCIGPPRKAGPYRHDVRIARRWLHRRRHFRGGRSAARGRWLAEGRSGWGRQRGGVCRGGVGGVV